MKIRIHNSIDDIASLSYSDMISKPGVYRVLDTKYHSVRLIVLDSDNILFLHTGSGCLASHDGSFNNPKYKFYKSEPITITLGE